MLALTAGGRRAEEQPAPKANPPPPSQHKGGKVTPAASTGCSQLPRASPYLHAGAASETITGR